MYDSTEPPLRSGFYHWSQSSVFGEKWTVLKYYRNMVISMLKPIKFWSVSWEIIGMRKRTKKFDSIPVSVGFQASISLQKQEQAEVSVWPDACYWKELLVPHRPGPVRLSWFEQDSQSHNQKWRYFVLTSISILREDTIKQNFNLQKKNSTKTLLHESLTLK